jgi:hypothetical protein
MLVKLVIRVQETWMLMLLNHKLYKILKEQYQVE